MSEIAIIMVFTACPLPEDPHWAVGHFPVGTWGGVEIRPDHFVVETDANGEITDVGRWWALGDDAIIYTSSVSPWREVTLSRDRWGNVTYVRDYGYGNSEEPVKVTRGHLPQEFDSYEIAF